MISAQHTTVSRAFAHVHLDIIQTEVCGVQVAI